MTSQEFRRALQLIIEIAEDGCVLLSETDKQILRKFEEEMKH